MTRQKSSDNVDSTIESVQPIEPVQSIESQYRAHRGSAYSGLWATRRNTAVYDEALRGNSRRWKQRRTGTRT